jgi:hypothetical protein
MTSESPNAAEIARGAVVVVVLDESDSEIGALICNVIELDVRTA